MKRSRIVRPETRVLTISEGDTLIVKKRLNHGERNAAFARNYIAGVDGKVRVNPLGVGMGKVCVYLIDWSLVDLEGNVIPIQGKSFDEVEASLNAIDPESFEEIKKAIDTHEDEMAAERAVGKPTDGELTSSATSPSPDAAAGDTNGSAS